MQSPFRVGFPEKTTEIGARLSRKLNRLIDSGAQQIGQRSAGRASWTGPTLLTLLPSVFSGAVLPACNRSRE